MLKDVEVRTNLHIARDSVYKRPELYSSNKVLVGMAPSRKMA